MKQFFMLSFAVAALAFLPLSALAAPAAKPVATPEASTPPAVISAAPAAPEAARKEDPCAAFSQSIDLYNVCQDRMMKINRMKEARDSRTVAPKAVATPAPAPAPAEGAGGTKEGAEPEKAGDAPAPEKPETNASSKK